MAANGRCFSVPVSPGKSSQILRIDRDDLLDRVTLVLDVIEQGGEIAIAVIQPEQGSIAIRRKWFCRSISRLIPIDDVNRFHIGLRLIGTTVITAYHGYKAVREPGIPATASSISVAPTILPCDTDGC